MMIELSHTTQAFLQEFLNEYKRANDLKELELQLRHGKQYFKEFTEKEDENETQ